MPFPNLQATRSPTPTRMKEAGEESWGRASPSQHPWQTTWGRGPPWRTTVHRTELIRKPWLRTVATDGIAGTQCSLFLGDPCGNACHSSSRGRIYKPWPPTPMRGRIALFKEGSVVPIIYRYKGQCIAMPPTDAPCPRQPCEPCEVSVRRSAEVNLPADTHLTAWREPGIHGVIISRSLLMEKKNKK